MIKKIVAILLASSMILSAAPLAVFANEPAGDVLDAIVNADDASFESAVEDLGEIEEPIVEDEEALPEAPEEESEPEHNMGVDSPDMPLQEATFNPQYDIMKIDNKFNSETNTGAPDGSAYKVSNGTDKIWDAKNIDLKSNYYLSVDFKLPAGVEGNQIMMTNGKDVGPQFSVRDGKLCNQVNSSSFPSLYDNFDVSKWYKLELEGRMMVVGSVTSFTLYEYDASGNATQVAHSNSLTLRNFSETGKKTYGYTTLTEGVCYDNEYAVQEYPDSVVLTEANGLSEVTGGDSLQFTVSAQRNSTSQNLTQPDITWSIAGVKEGEEDYIKIDDNRLTVNALASDQDIVLKATAESNGNPYAEYPVTVHKRDISGELFDAITVSGSGTIDAGSSESYTFAATKNGVDVTSTLGDGDVKWHIMDSTGARVLGNRYITAENGVVTVDKDVLGQDIRVRASTTSGYVYGETVVAINGKSTETIIQSDACEEKVQDNKAFVRQGSWDGSSYYVKNTTDDFLTSGTLKDTSTGGDVLISMDLKFMNATGSGITTIRRDGGTGLWLCSHNGLLAAQTGNTAYNDLKANGAAYSLDPEAWYHIELMFNTSKPSLNIWKYNENGEKVDKATFTSADGLVFRSTQGFNRVKLNGDTGLDNYKVLYPDPTALEIVADSKTVPAGASVAFGISGSREGLAMPNIAMQAVNWAVYDSKDVLPIEGDDVTITAGVLTTNGLTLPQTVYVRAISTKDKSVYASIPVSITAANQFEITNVGYDAEDERHLVRIFANKLTDYKNEVVFIMTFYDSEGKLIGSYAKKANAKNLKTGENEITIDYTLPESYDKQTGQAKIMAWTSLTTKEEPESVSGEFAATYANGTITLVNLPTVSGKVTAAVYYPEVKDGDLTGDTSTKIVYVSQSEVAINSIAVPNLAPGTYTVAIGGIEVDGKYSVHRAEFTVE
jgi:hypothetical protein